MFSSDFECGNLLGQWDQHNRRAYLNSMEQIRPEKQQWSNNFRMINDFLLDGFSDALVRNNLCD